MNLAPLGPLEAIEFAVVRISVIVVFACAVFEL
jgi:hypothetical protein